jgi:amidase
MEVHEYASHDAVGLRELLRDGEVSAAEVEATARRALDAAAPLNALAAPVFSPALASSPSGPFAGVPFLIKDSGPMAAGVPFALGSRAVRGAVARHDSELMSRFRAAGLVMLGLTTVPELALSFATESVKHGPTRNPWDLDRGVGGSSGGAAALVAAGAVPLAHGNDGAGSLRIPAACCGLVGLKPSRGRTPCGPDAGEALFGMACEFALTRSVRDAAHLLDALHGPAPGDKYTAPPPAEPYARRLDPPPPLRVAVTTQGWGGVPVGAEVAAATGQAARRLAELGHHVEEATPVVDLDLVVDACVAGQIAQASHLLTAPRAPDPAKLEATTRQLLAEAARAGALDLLASLDAHNRVSRSIGAFFTAHDLLVTPTLAQLPAPHHTLRYDEPGHTGRSWLRTLFAYGPFTAPFNLSGQPAISLPLGHSRAGLPIGVQLVAPYGREDLLLRAAAQLERADPWRDRQAAVAGVPGGSHRADEAVRVTPRPVHPVRCQLSSPS